MKFSKSVGLKALYLNQGNYQNNERCFYLSIEVDQVQIHPLTLQQTYIETRLTHYTTKQEEPAIIGSNNLCHNGYNCLTYTTPGGLAYRGRAIGADHCARRLRRKSKATCRCQVRHDGTL